MRRSPLKDWVELRIHSRQSGVAHLAADDDDHCCKLIRQLLSYLPSNNRQTPPETESQDNL